MKTIELNDGTVVKVPTFCDLPIVGLGAIPGHNSLILTNEYGYARRIVTHHHFSGTGSLLSKAYKLRPDYFCPGDKGCLTVYGVGTGGLVVFGCAVYSGNIYSQNIVEQEKHLYIELKSIVSPW